MFATITDAYVVAYEVLEKYGVDEKKIYNILANYRQFFGTFESRAQALEYIHNNPNKVNFYDYCLLKFDEVEDAPNAFVFYAQGDQLNFIFNINSSRIYFRLWQNPNPIQSMAQQVFNLQYSQPLNSFSYFIIYYKNNVSDGGFTFFNTTVNYLSGLESLEDVGTQLIGGNDSTSQPVYRRRVSLNLTNKTLSVGVCFSPNGSTYPGGCVPFAVIGVK